MVYHIIYPDYFMTHHIIDDSNESGQMYLITIARLIEDGCPEPIPISDIANQMSVLPVSVNQMIRKLEETGLLNYQPYKGVELTSRGVEIASRTLRNRRLWEVFLVDHLKLSLEDADAIACTIEHVTTDEIAHRLSQFLGDPAISPGGRLIPVVNSDQAIQDWIPLSNLEVGMQAHITHIEADPTVSRYLIEEGLRQGSLVVIKAIGALGNRLIEAENGCIELSADITDTIEVSRSKNSRQISLQVNSDQG
jgi:DtxR family Mn-dependent transcriptional regulator